MATSIGDVARLAGVSVATVSRALRGLPDVAPRTRARVVTAARRLDYTASPHAARLASGRTGTVAVLAPFLNRWFFAEALAGIEALLSAAQLDLLLYQIGDRARRDRFFGALPVRKRVDAVLVLSLVLSGPERDALDSLRVPIGVLGGEPDPTVHWVGIDDRAGASTAVGHLLALGHHRIAHLGGDPRDPAAFAPPRPRRRGYLDALATAGLDYDPDLDVVGYYTVTGAHAATEKLLTQADRPTAVFADSDEMAYGALRAARRRGFTLPGDLAVIGFDDQPSAALLDVSTIHQPVAEQAHTLVADLLTELNLTASPAGTKEPAPPAAHVLATRLVVRGSTDPACSLDRDDGR